MATRTKATDAPDETEVEETEEQKADREAREKDNEEARKLADEQYQRDKERGEKALANAPDPENPDDQDKFSSLLTRDTTHFQNVHYSGGGPTDTISAASPLSRVQALQALLAATNFNVNASISGWDYATQKALADFQGEGGSGEVDRATWDKLSDILFAKPDDSKKKEPKPASVPTGG
jgi:hypothetical protein